MPVWKFVDPGIAYPQYSLLEGILASRGMEREQLHPGAGESPFSIPGMDTVTRRLAAAAANGERLLVFGDYDCDGVCSAYLMTSFLSQCGAEAITYLPTRQEGYGINPEQVRQAAAEHYDLIVTVDNGVSAFQAAETAHLLGIDLLVTDHHEPLQHLPDVPLADPKLPGTGCYRDYSGTGVAYLACCAVADLLQRPHPDQFLDLVSLATVVDVCPITGENYRLCRLGLLQLRQQLRPGLAALMQQSKAKQVNGQVMGWILGPSINAAGRLGDPMLAYRLIAADNSAEAEQLARELDKIRKESQAAVKAATESCLEQYDGAAFPVFASDDWGEGIVGIAAGRLVNNLNRPAAVGYFSEGQVKFSARSIGDFDLVAVLEECQRRTNALINHGGHKGAAGFCLKIEDLPLIRENLAAIAAEMLQPEDLADWLKIDARLEALPRLQEVEQLDLLEPFGRENPEPTFYIKDQAVEVKCGKGWTLVRTAAGIKFFTSEEVEPGALVHAAINLRVDEHRGYQSIIGSAADVRLIICARDDLLQRYLAWRHHRQIPPWAEMIFRELGLEQQGENRKTNLFKSPTFLRYGSVKA